MKYLQFGSFRRYSLPHYAVYQDEDERDPPSHSHEPFYGDFVSDENHHQREMQMQPLAKHPHVIDEHEVLRNYVDRLTPPLKINDFITAMHKRENRNDV